MQMSKRAADILDLEHMLDNGLGDDMLCRRAIEIYERLIEEKKKFRYRISIEEAGVVDAQCADFKRVLKIIKRRRHAKVLDQFDIDLKRIGGDLTFL